MSNVWDIDRIQGVIVICNMYYKPAVLYEYITLTQTEANYEKHTFVV